MRQIDKLDRAEAFVRDCFTILRQPRDGENVALVRQVALKVLKAINHG